MGRWGGPTTCICEFVVGCPFYGGSERDPVPQLRAGVFCAASPVGAVSGPDDQLHAVWPTVYGDALHFGSVSGRSTFRGDWAVRSGDGDVAAGCSGTSAAAGSASRFCSGAISTRRISAAALRAVR